MSTYRVRRIGNGERATARRLFEVMAEVFEEDAEGLSDSWVDALLARDSFWALAAFDGDAIVGGITAHTLPMTRSETRELFICDVAVDAKHQRRGVGKMMMNALADLAAQENIRVLFVPASNEDTHAIDFYRAVGGVSEAVTFFTFAS